MKTVLTILGILLIAMGLLFAGQGTGVVAWPASSTMIDQRPWVVRGLVLAGIGVVLVVLARRRR
jgi:hypothetical protein